MQVLMKSREHQAKTLSDVAREISTWNVKVIKLKAVYHAMNMFLNEGQNFVAECWVPYAELGSLQAVVNRASVCLFVFISNKKIADTLRQV